MNELKELLDKIGDLARFENGNGDKVDNRIKGSYIMTRITSNNNVGMGSATLAYSSRFKRR